MATESLLMTATVKGGDRQQLHEVIRQHSMTAHEAVSQGKDNPLIELLIQDPSFDLDPGEIEEILQPEAFTGRAAHQVLDYLSEVVNPALENVDVAAVEEPRV